MKRERYFTEEVYNGLVYDVEKLAGIDFFLETINDEYKQQYHEIFQTNFYYEMQQLETYGEKIRHLYKDTREKIDTVFQDVENVCNYYQVIFQEQNDNLTSIISVIDTLGQSIDTRQKLNVFSEDVFFEQLKNNSIKYSYFMQPVYEERFQVLKIDIHTALLNFPEVVKFFFSYIYGKINTNYYIENEATLNEFICYLKGYIPQMTESQSTLAVYLILSSFKNRVTDEVILSQFKNNMSIDMNQYLSEDGYLECQSNMSAIHYGFYLSGEEAGINYNGCEIIATFNALVHLNGGKSPILFPTLIMQYSRNGIALDGEWGTAPDSINSLFVSNGYETEMVIAEDLTDEKLAQLTEEYDTYIITVYNEGTDVTQMVHTMCITKDVDADGNVIYTLHNDYSSKQYDDNETFYGFTYANSIEDVMSQYQDGNYRLIDLIGVKLT